MTSDSTDRYKNAQRTWFGVIQSKRAAGLFDYNADEGPVYISGETSKSVFTRALLGIDPANYNHWEKGEVARDKVQDRLETVMFGKDDITRYRTSSLWVEVATDERRRLQKEKSRFHRLWQTAVSARDEQLLTDRKSGVAKKGTVRLEDALDLYSWNARYRFSLDNASGMRAALAAVFENRLYDKALRGLKNGQRWVVERPSLLPIIHDVCRVLDEYQFEEPANEGARQIIYHLDSEFSHYSSREDGLTSVQIRSLQNACWHTDNRTPPEDEIDFANSHEIPEADRLQTYACAACRYVNECNETKALEALNVVESRFPFCSEQTKGIWFLHHGRLSLRVNNHSSADLALYFFQNAEKHFKKSSRDHVFIPHSVYYQGLALRQLGHHENAAKLLVEGKAGIEAGIGESCLRPEQAL